MAHKEQRDFFQSVKDKFPEYFSNKTVLDFGSLDVNGSLKDLFTDCNYTGIDIVSGKNVDVISTAHEYQGQSADVVTSGEMLEHDEYWKQSLQNMYDKCNPGGLIAISCAGKDRPEHGTRRSDGNEWGTGDYYRNIEPKDIKTVYKKEMFSEVHYEENANSKDTYFYGIKV